MSGCLDLLGFTSLQQVYYYSNITSGIVFQEQSYSSLHSGGSSAWDHVRGVIADPCGIVTIPEAIGDADHCATH